MDGHLTNINFNFRRGWVYAPSPHPQIGTPTCKSSRKFSHGKCSIPYNPFPTQMHNAPDMYIYNSHVHIQLSCTYFCLIPRLSGLFKYIEKLRVGLGTRLHISIYSVYTPTHTHTHIPAPQLFTVCFCGPGTLGRGAVCIRQPYLSVTSRGV